MLPPLITPLTHTPQQAQSPRVGVLCVCACTVGACTRVERNIYSYTYICIHKQPPRDRERVRNAILPSPPLRPGRRHRYYTSVPPRIFLYARLYLHIYVCTRIHISFEDCISHGPMKTSLNTGLTVVYVYVIRSAYPTASELAPALVGDSRARAFVLGICKGLGGAV